MANHRVLTSLKLLSLAMLSSFAAAQGQACQVIEESFVSKLIDRKNPQVEKYVVLLPKNYNPARFRYSVTYFLHGRTLDRHSIVNLGACKQLDLLVDGGSNPYLIVAPDGNLSYWQNGAYNGLRYADMITQELIADVQKKYSVIDEQAGRLIAGISMGGNGATELTLDNPHLFAATGAHSPVYRTQWQALTDFPLVFGIGSEYTDRDPVSELKSGRRLKRPIFMDMGAQDPFLERTRECAKLFEGTGTPGRYEVGNLDGAHNDAFWIPRLPIWMDWYAKQLAAPRAK